MSDKCALEKKSYIAVSDHCLMILLAFYVRICGVIIFNVLKMFVNRNIVKRTEMVIGWCGKII